MMTVNPKGAHPHEWDLWSQGLGFTEWLLPIVCNTDAVVAKTSTLSPSSLCKVPSKYNELGEVVGVGNWQKLKTAQSSVEFWKRISDYGIGLKTGELRAIDIDIDIPETVSAILDIINRYMPGCPKRVRTGSSRTLILYRTEVSGPKIILRHEHGCIELLGEGQQCVVAGTHKSGVRHEWEGDLHDIHALDPETERHMLETLRAYTGGAASILTTRDRNPPGGDADINDPVVPFLKVLSVTQDNTVFIRCPFESEHTTPSSLGSTAYFPRGTRGYDKGHFKCLHAHCADRTDADFLAAIGYVEDVSEFFPVSLQESTLPESPSDKTALSDSLGGLPFKQDIIQEYKRRGDRILPTTANIYKALWDPSTCGCELSYDVFLGETLLKALGQDKWSLLTDTHVTDMCIALELMGFDTVPRHMVQHVVKSVAEKRKRDSVSEWIRTLEWDGVPRVETFFTKYLTTEDTEYTRAIGRYLWTALAGRCLSANTKATMVPILVGDQGQRKGSAIAAMSPSPEYHSRVSFKRDFKDIVWGLRGKLIAELPELEGMSSREIGSVKAFVGEDMDDTRKMYSMTSERYQRRWIMMGTTNEHECLIDLTGNRRWLPVIIRGKINPENIVRDRTQLWAEGLDLFRKHGVLYQDAERLGWDETEFFRVQDGLELTIKEWLRGREDTEPFRMQEVYTQALRRELPSMTIGDSKKIGLVLRRLGYGKIRVRTKENPGVADKMWKLMPKDD